MIKGTNRIQCICRWENPISIIPSPLTYSGWIFIGVTIVILLYTCNGCIIYDGFFNCQIYSLFHFFFLSPEQSRTTYIRKSYQYRLWVQIAFGSYGEIKPFKTATCQISFVERLTSIRCNLCSSWNNKRHCHWRYPKSDIIFSLSL